ncbi:MAG: leucine-rich repeat protein [Metamycoplasmataceae bacterium]
MNRSKYKKILFNKFSIIPTAMIFFPLIALTSCSDKTGDFNNDVELLKEFLTKNQAITSVDSRAKELPAKIYIDNPETSISAFKITNNLQELLDQTSISAKFNYSKSQPDGDKIRFDVVYFKNGKVILELESIMSGFISRTEYVSKSRNYLQSLNLNNSIRNKYTLKSFLELLLPKPGQSSEWNNLLDFICPPGYIIKFNDDIKSFRYDSRNQKLVIGTFISTIGFTGNQEEEMSVSVTNNFMSPTKPLSVFMVDDNGVDTSILTSLGVNSEVVFINRTTDGIIKFNQKFNGQAIYGDLDFSNFRNWKLPEDNFESKNFGLFQGNFITSVKLPLGVSTLPSKIFRDNKILNFDTENHIAEISDDSFDSHVKYGNSIIRQLGLSMYYIEELKTLDFSKRKEIATIDDLVKLLKLVVRNNGELAIEHIILPAQLFGETESISNISKLRMPIKVNKVTLFSQDKTNIHSQFSLSDWTISNLIIPKEIISINMSSLKQINRKIERELNPDIRKLVVNDTLDLRNSETIAGLTNYNKKLNYYFDIDRPEENIISKLYLENSDTPSFSDFDSIFKLQNQGFRNTIYISSQTIVVEDIFIRTISLSSLIGIKIERDIPENLVVLNGHLNLSNSNNIFVDFFYKNIIYLDDKINEITLPMETKKIPNHAFSTINLSNTKLNYNNDKIMEIGDYAFHKTNIGGELFLPNVKLIGSFAFADNILEGVSLPEATSIGQSAFKSNKITKINLPKVIMINHSSFNDNLLSSINLPEVIVIDDFAFHKNNLLSINLPKVNLIGESSFVNNSNLISINLNSRIKINKNSFDSFTNIKIDDEEQFLIPNLVTNDNGKITINFNNVFEGRHSFTDAINQLNLQLWNTNNIIDEIIWNPDLPNDSIGLDSTNIISVKKLTIMSSNNEVVEIPRNLFYGIKIDDVYGLENVTSILDGAFWDSQIQKFNGIEGNLMFGPNLKILGNNAFRNNNIRNLSFQAGSTLEISSGSFVGNRNLLNINIPHTIKFVHSNAFDSAIWKNVKRVPFQPSSQEEKLPWSYDFLTGVVVFNEMVSRTQIENNIKTLNGLKIKEIKFADTIYFIPNSFLRSLMNSWTIIEVDLSSILVLESFIFPSSGIKIKPGSMENIVYNDINSGITYNF